MGERYIRQRNYVVRRPQAEPEHESRLMLGLAVIGEVLAGLVVLALICAAFWLWLSIGVAVQP